MNWCLPFYYARLPNLTHGPGMPFDKVDTLYHYPFILGMNKAHLALLTPLLTGDNQHDIILSNPHRH